jgi:iron complex transport system substrate-binding protein
MKRCWCWIFIWAILLITFTGLSCGSKEIPTTPYPTPTITRPADTAPSVIVRPETRTAYPLQVSDDLGRKITVEKIPQRIVSLAPSITEILFALGLDDRIVGVTDYCDYPEGAKTKPRVASYTTPNMEKLISIQPDIIFAESIHEKTVLPALQNLNLKVAVTAARSIDTVLYDIELIGKIADKQDAANDLTAELRKKIDAISQKTQGLTEAMRPRVLYVVWFEPIWSMGSNTYINDLIYAAGGLNIFADDFEESRIVSLESIITANPQVIIVTGMATSGDTIYNAVKSETRLGNTEAMLNNRIYKVSDANIIERPGPRITLGLQELAQLIHPEIFGIK